ncbi:MAG: TetR/AcrR family transcriptional regulator [Hyphomonas sp.]
MTKGEQTRLRLLDIAQDAVLSKGFAATSIEEIIAEAGITKSGFFYHFRDKNDLARALLQRYIDDETILLDELIGLADGLDEDPLHGFLIFLKLLADRLSDLPNGHPGCMVAAYCYQEHLFSHDIRELYAGGQLAWRQFFGNRLRLIAEKYPPRIETDFDALADMFSAVVDGGIILSKAIRDPSLLPQQVMLYRSFIKAVFAGTN